MNALKPATIQFDDVHLDFVTRTAVVTVSYDQREMAAGPGGGNLRLASLLSGWDIRLETR